PAIVAEDMVGGPFVLVRMAVVNLIALVPAERGVVGIPSGVVADVQVEVAVAVEVGEGRRGGGGPRPGQARTLGHILEGLVAPIAEEGVPAQAGEEEVGPSVVVVIADGDAHAVS